MNNLSDFEIELIKFINEGLLLNLIGGNELVYLRPYSNGFAHVFQCGEDTSQRVLVFFAHDRLYMNSLEHPTKMKEIVYADLSTLGLAVDIVNAVIDDFTAENLFAAAQAQQAAWN